MMILTAASAGSSDFVIPGAYAAAILPALFVGVASLIAFLFRQNARSNEALATVAEQLRGLERRTSRLEDAVYRLAPQNIYNPSPPTPPG